MIQFRADSERGPIYGIGLTPANIAHLVAGGPVIVSLAELGGPKVTVLLMYGADHDAISATLAENGMGGAEEMGDHIKEGVKAKPKDVVEERPIPPQATPATSDRMKGAFAAGALFGYLHEPESKDQFKGVQSVRRLMADQSRPVRASAIRTLFLAAMNEPWLAALHEWLARIDVTLEDTSWELLDYYLGGCRQPEEGDVERN